MNPVIEQLRETIVELGATKSGALAVSDIKFDPAARKACEENYCGNYDRNWTCPPLCGDVFELIERAKGYQSAVLFQSISSLKDSYDIEGMTEAADRHNEVVRSLQRLARDRFGDAVVLGSGGCSFCSVCARVNDEPCRFPDEATTSLEAYGMYVSHIAKQAGMKYINGQNTVTYFGMVLLKEPLETA